MALLEFEGARQKVDVVLISGHGLMRQMLAETLQVNGLDVVAVFNSVDMLTEVQPDYVYVIQMPKSPHNWGAVLKSLAHRNPSVKVLALCREDEVGRLSSEMPVQVRAIISDRFPTDVLMSAIRLVHAGLGVSSFEDEGHAYEEVREGHVNNEAMEQSKSAYALLTKREVAVLSRLSVGEENKSIANDLGLSEATVKVHLRRLFRKTGAKNRTQAALWGARNL